MEKAKRGPNRRRVECGFIEDERAREVTFSKRRQGLFRKATELSILCGVEIAVITFSPHGNPFVFAHPSTPDGLIGCYLSGRAPPPAESDAAAHRNLEEEKSTKLEETEKEAGKISAGPRKGNRWWEEAEVDSMDLEELEQYVASLEGLMKLVADSLSGGSPPTAASDAAVDRNLEAEKPTKLEETEKEEGKISAVPRKGDRWWEEAEVDGMDVEELEQYVASLEGLRKSVADSLGQRDDSDFYDRLLATDKDISLDLDAAFLAELQDS